MRYQKLLSEVTIVVGSLWWYIIGICLYSTDDQVGIIFHHFLPSLHLLLFGFVFCMFDTFSGSFPINTFLLISQVTKCVSVWRQV